MAGALPGAILLYAGHSLARFYGHPLLGTALSGVEFLPAGCLKQQPS